MAVPPTPPSSCSADRTGSRFLDSVGVALAVAAWGAVCGSLVESAVGSGPPAWRGAILGAVLLASCGAALAAAEGRRVGTKEALGRALREGLRSSWQGAWLGGLIGGAFAAGGGLGLVLLLVAVPTATGLAGLFLSRLVGAGGRVGGLNLALSLALLGAVIVATCCGAAGAPALSRQAVAAAVQESPVFGPAAGWAWGLGGAAPLVVAVSAWWFWTYRRERARDGERSVGLGWALATLVFIAGLAGGLGAAAGTAVQWLAGQLVLGGAVTPTPGKWLGAAVALLLWGSGRQPVTSLSVAAIRERLAAAVSALRPQAEVAADEAAAVAEAR